MITNTAQISDSFKFIKTKPKLGWNYRRLNERIATGSFSAFF